MATVPVTRTWVAGEVVLASHFNSNIRDVLNYLLAPPIAELRQTSTQSLTTAVFGSVTFDTEDVDSAGGHSTSSNTSRYTAVYAGWYPLGGAVCFASNATGIRAVRWAVNGTAVNASSSTVTTINGNVVDLVARAKRVFLNVGDYVEMQAFQNSGGSLSTSASGADASSMTLGWESN